MINQDRLLCFFEQLVTIDNPSFGERNMCDFITGKLKSLGITPTEDDVAEKINGNCGNLHAFIEGTGAKADLSPILFSGHMDSVEPSRGKKMLIDGNGLITSDGTTVLGSDDLAAVAVIVEALTALKESGISHRPIEILFSVAEEPYCVGIRQFDFSKLRSKEAYVFDLSGPVGGAAYQAPTILSFKAQFIGRSAHAGFAPEDGIHAIKAAADAIVRIDCGKVGESTVNIGTISGGKADNIVPDSCTVTGEIRSFSDEEANSQLDSICKILEQSADRFGAKVDLQTSVNFTAYATPKNHPVVKRFQSVCNELNLPEYLCKTFGGSDNNYLVLHGVSGIVVATAMNNCHSTTEYTSKQELERAAQVALALMLSNE